MEKQINENRTDYENMSKEELEWLCMVKDLKIRTMKQLIDEPVLKKAIETLNFYRNLYYTESLGTKKRELADVINEMLPRLSKLMESNEIAKL